MTILTFEVLGRPKGAQRHRAVKRGAFVRMHHTDEHLAAEDRIARLAQLNYEGIVLDIPVRVVIEAWHKRPLHLSNARKWWGTPPGVPCTAKPDLDNVAKLIMDSLTRAGVWKDDTCVAELVVTRRYLGVNSYGQQAGLERTMVRVEAL